jgi:HSP20 family molecular chaperone IbpA
MSVFNSPLFLGFDHFERAMDRVSKASPEGYPPYNIEQIGDYGFRISLAVAGFREEDLSCTLEDNQLIIRGRNTQDDQDRIFLHKGIATRQFQRSFVLAEGIEVVGATMDNGLLHIDLERPLPEVQVREIKIQSRRQKAEKAYPALDVSPRRG